jgi:hypothetical protein
MVLNQESYPNHYGAGLALKALNTLIWITAEPEGLPL